MIFIALIIYRVPTAVVARILSLTGVASVKLLRVLRDLSLPG